MSRRVGAGAACSLAFASALLWGRAALGAPPQLPVTCAAGPCGAIGSLAKQGFTGTANFVNPGQGQATPSYNGNTLTVSQSSSQAILNWSSFNIGAGGQVIFQQPSSTSIALNKIYQASPSSIFGALTANGQIYLINPNGFVFGNGATVNAAGLMASSLGLANGDTEFTNGILSQISQAIPQPALQSDSRVYVTDASGNLVLDGQGNAQPVQVIVQPGAQITAADGGRILLAGQQVVNGGALSAPQGQIVLAAGQTIYLQASGDPSLRGLVVAVSNTVVDSSTGSSETTPGSTGVGTISNESGGTLSAPQGNVSLLGLAVNQSGRISATTAVSANGSVVLEAGQGQAQNEGCTNGLSLCTTQGGTLDIGASSEIDVLPELDDTTTAAVAQPQMQSSVQLTGEQIDIQGGQINAPGGSLSVLAAANPNLGLATEGNTAAQIRVASGTSIDLAGSDAVLPMSANLLTIQLRGTELEDDPDQRNGALEGQTVVVDTRGGEPPIVSETAWLSDLQGVQESVAQRTSQGGSASFQSEGDIIVNSGATINVSGGAWTYEPGIVQTSELIASNGRLYNIDTASPLLDYTSVINPTYTQGYSGFGVQITAPTPGLSHEESGYVEGFSAGTVSFAAPAMSLGGTLIGTAVNGPYQRSGATIPASSLAAVIADGGNMPSSGADAMASGGTLIIGDPNASVANSSVFPAFFAPAVTFSTSAAPVDVPDGAPLALGTLDLPISYITNGGFQNTEIFSDSSVTLPAGLPLSLSAGGSLLAVAPQIAIGSSIQALGGSINLESAETLDSESTGEGRPGIEIASGVTLDVSGQWTNDSTDAPATAQTATYQNGGTIVLSLTPSSGDLPVGILPANSTNLSQQTSGGELVLGSDVSLLANGGAWLQYTSAVVGGTGGRITIDASPYQSALQVGNNVTLAAFGVEGAAGGNFTLQAPRIAVVPGSGSWAGAQSIDDLLSPGDFFDVDAGLFSEDGFSSVNLTATAPVLPGAASSDVLAVTGGTNIDALAQSLELTSGFLMRPTGGTVQGFTQAQTLPVADQTPYSISLQVIPATTDPATTVVGDLDVQDGASIVAGPGSTTGSTINLQGQGSILIDGELQALGGDISAQISPPTTENDPGYLPNQEIELGPQAVLDTGGIAVMTPNILDLPLGTVLPGGTVSLIADRGEVVADPGSIIDIAGGSAVLDVPTYGGSGGYRSAVMGSAGGSLLVQSVESVSLLGGLSAAGGMSSAGELEGGSLELDLTDEIFSTSSSVTNPFPFNQTPYTIELVPSTAGTTSPSAPDADTAVLGVAQLEQSGIDALTLTALNNTTGSPAGTIELESGTPLALGREISLDAPNLAVGSGVAASLTAPYVILTDSGQATSGANPTPGTGTLSVSAQEIALSGYVTLQGVQSATLTSSGQASSGTTDSGDVQLEPLAGDELSGGLTLAGDLTIAAARVYPATLASYTISDPAGTVTIEQTTASPGTPLSAGGSLTIDAASIVSSGTLLAPFGQIQLSATNSLDLESGSVTSVSADGATIPFGQTTLGQGEWIYQASANDTIPITGVPPRQIALSGAQITFSQGASIDVSGGGDLSAYEWVPGLGGSIDALGQANATAAGLYAVLPSTEGQYAAYDLQEFTGSNVATGESVYLSGVEGLPSGLYPLLPARYALMPGAYLVQIEPSYQSLTPGTIGALTDGTPVVAGYLSFGDTGLRSASGYTGFAVWPGSYGQSLAQYTISYASSFFGASGTGQVVVPADAGTLMIAVDSSLSVLGNVNASAGSGGTAGTIDIYTPGPSNITVAAAPPASGGNGGVWVDSSAVQNWDAGDLILGGELSADGSSIAVTASSLTFGPGTLSADQILAVADQLIEVQSGAVVESTSSVTGIAPKTLPADQPMSLTTSGGASDSDAALLAVSDTSLPIAVRGVPGSGGGMVQIDEGATLGTLGAVSLDAPGSVTVNGHINAPGASWSLSSSSIGFVGSGGSGTGDMLQIGSTLLADLQAAGAVRLASAGSIDLWTPVSLGATETSSTPTLQSLTLSASEIDNETSGSSVFGAQTLTLEGNGTGAATPTAAPAGQSSTLTLVANQLDVGSGYLDINGFTQATLQATDAITGQGSGQLSIGGSEVTLAAPELTAASQSAAALSVPSGSLQIAQLGTAAAPSTLAGSLGGGLTLSANDIADSGSIIIPGGRISLQAASDITLGGSALVDASGITVSAMGETEGAAGGIVNISAGGNLSLPGGATISVSGAGDAPAGSITLSGGGLVALGATLTGNAAAGATGGSFSLYAGQLSGGLSPALVDNLTSGGFSHALAIEVGSGDLDLQSSGCATNVDCTLAANDITLSADSGAVNIYGALTANAGGQSGFIGVYGGTGVTLEPGGALTANGIASQGHGGEIVLSSTCVSCSVTLAGGATVTTNGGADSGDLIIQAPALSGANDVAINVGEQGLQAAVNAGEVILEPVFVYGSETSTSINSDLATDVANAASYLTTASPAISSRLTAGPTPVSVQAGVVLEDPTPTDTIGLTSFDLSSYSEQGQVVDLTFRAAGSIDIDGTVSDGYAGIGSTALTSQPSASLTFVAGANLGSADPLGTVSGSGGDLNVGSVAQPALVRTGTGDIDLVASGDVTFAQGSSAYTTGVAPAGTAPQSVPTENGTGSITFSTGGGNLVVDAGEDVVGVPVAVSASSWQLRDVKGSYGEYGVDLNEFDQNPWTLATFGGGDLTVTAGRDVTNVSAATADSLYLAGTAQTGFTQTSFAGGGLTVAAGRNVTSGQFLDADGTGTLSAGQAFNSNLTASDGSAVGSAFYLENSELLVSAEGSIAIEGVMNPTAIADPLLDGHQASYGFFTYGPSSAFIAQSTSGDVTVENTDTGLAPLLGEDVVSSFQAGLYDYPGTLKLLSLTQSITFGQTQTGVLSPANNGQLELFAGQDIVDANLQMSDAPDADVPTATPAVATATTNLNAVGDLDSYGFLSGRHLNDPAPASILAGGNIDDADLQIPKATDIEAGEDILDLQFQGQNLNPNDLTLIYAGRNFSDAPTFLPNGAVEGAAFAGIVQVSGPGRLDILAGGTINLGFSQGVTTVGNLLNANLSSTGADITMMAGFGQASDDSNFLQKIVEPSATYQQELIAYVESLTGQTGLSAADADAEFVGFGSTERQPFIDDVFFSELNASGLAETANASVGFARGYDAIEALFPGSPEGSTPASNGSFNGDLDLSYSQIYTEAGGNISLLVPGGSINVGLANPPASLQSHPKPASQLGIVAEGAGNVDIYSEGDVNVDTSRIFTLGGGNILIWSQEGSIDAGNGAKSSLSLPAPTIAYTANGNPYFTFDTAVAGSGIRTIQSTSSVPAGNVNLIAPVGIVNAGDAGIGAAGNINIAAASVLGAANINFGGTATGVPALVSNVTASVSGSASAASGATTSVTSSLAQSNTPPQQAPLAQAALSWLDVFVTGLGMENCAPADAECLNREQQK